MSAIFEIKQLSKRIPAGDGLSGERLLLNHINAVIQEPESIAMMGASGQGKSTLLRILACLESADEGELYVHGSSCRSMDRTKWRSQVCYVAQQAVMLPGSVEDNLRTVSRLHGTAYEEQLAIRLMDRSGLDSITMKKSAEDLSGGEKQRLALIRSLMLRPSVLLLDEVTASLDAVSGRLIEEVLMDWHNSEGTSMLWVTHHADQARRVASRAWTLEGGKLLDSGSHSLPDWEEDKEELLGSVNQA
ncbi:ABC transporter ATP-binding protein [Paenibacillus paeoniae]|uniref:ABC transporter ATP-binding protein n=1 Tax=Paenibacillus paeoniae TaxID=2292705 RepID=UPI001403A73C|nr:ATP-binding cassette domain-containing protein [Paenibacillus paeoniae]